MDDELYTRTKYAPSNELWAECWLAKDLAAYLWGGLCACVRGACVWRRHRRGFAANEFIFRAFMCACAAYLVFLAIKMWQNARNTEFRAQKTNAKLGALFVYGFTSCLSNPKSWAAFVALLPPFLDKATPLNAKFALIVALVIVIEFANMCLYMLGGLMLRKVLATRAALFQRFSATLIVLVALMMVVSVFWGEKV